MSADSDFWATLLVLQFRFDPQKRARRISEATIDLCFDVSDTSNELPEVEAVSFDGNYSFLPSSQSETMVTGGDGGFGASYGVELNASLKWERTVVRETANATTVSGGKLVIGNMPPTRQVDSARERNSQGRSPGIHPGGHQDQTERRGSLHILLDSRGSNHPG